MNPRSSRIVAWVKRVCGPSKVPGGNREQNRFLLASWAVLAAIGFFIPEQIVSDHVWAKEFTDFMASIVPQIDRVTALNLRPEVNRFHYSVLWAVSPVYFVIVMISGMKNVTLGYYRATKGKIVGILFFSIFMIGFSVFLWPTAFFYSMDPSNRVTRMGFYVSPFREMFAPFVVGGLSIGAVLIIMTIKGLLTGQLIILKEEEGDTADGK